LNAVLVIPLDVQYAFDDASRRIATISWTTSCESSPDQWQLTVKNLTMGQNVDFHEKIIFTFSSDDSEYTRTKATSVRTFRKL